jgi:hypothetical protein
VAVVLTPLDAARAGGHFDARIVGNGGILTVLRAFRRGAVFLVFGFFLWGFFVKALEVRAAVAGWQWFLVSLESARAGGHFGTRIVAIGGILTVLWWFVVIWCFACFFYY